MNFIKRRMVIGGGNNSSFSFVVFKTLESVVKSFLCMVVAVAQAFNPITWEAEAGGSPS